MFFYLLWVDQPAQLFSYFKDLYQETNTFIVFIDIFYDNFLFILFFFDGICCICYCIRFVERLSFFFIICMYSCCACWKFLELIPVIYYLITTCPSFFQVMEYWLTRMKITSTFTIFLLVVVFETSVTNTSLVSFFLHLILNIYPELSMNIY